ncbi:MAG: hypothetical protein HC941_09265 [Microcoleus sp. SU_5_3]|nr:hypothetical protein [Microcoleus sp. SU_5_3]
MVSSIIESTEIKISESPCISLEEWMHNPPDDREWVNGELVEKSGMTLKHSLVQSKLATCWRNYKDSSDRGGEVYTEPPCRTNGHLLKRN